jgi:tellurite resistance protein TerC
MGTNGVPEHTDGIAGWRLWTFFTVAVGIALTLDLYWGSQKAAVVRPVRAAIIASAAWLSLGFAFAGFLAISYGGSVGFTFLTGYLIEKSLSVDNLVVIALIFRSFRIKPVMQGPVLKWGIFGAVFFRAFFIFAGVWLLEHLHIMMYLFGGLLLYSAYKMLAEDDDDGDDAYSDAHKGNSWMMRCMTTFIPYSPDSRGTGGFFENVNGVLHATPMFAALVVVELSDLIFAIDSIPCILGLTHDLFLVFSSNMLAILGLRSLYLLLAEALDNVKNLKTGLGVVLGFVGVKMMAGDYFPLSQTMSLLVIFGILGATVAISVQGAGKRPAKLSSILPV